MPQAERKQNAIRQSVRVDCPIEDAFRLFTEAFGEWWPLALYSIRADEAETCAMEPWVGGRVFERTRSGEQHDWGSVIEWDPPERVKFSWDPAGVGDRNQTVDVEFSADADGTRVTLIHTGWETSGVAVCALRTDHGAMWSALLEHFFSVFAAEQMLAMV
jgi:uncharacterized protein YndB with AHSA1/START domain